MKKQLFAMAAASAAILTGCVLTSVHPFYTSNDVVFEPSLVGQWTNGQQANERWTFEKEGQNSYLLTYVVGDDTSVVQAHLFKLSGQMFMDIAGQEQEWKTQPPPTPSHLLLRVTQLSPTVQMVPLNHDWLKALLEKDPRVLHHELIKGPKPEDSRVVLTGETAELQAFLRKNLKNDEAWKDGFELKRDRTRASK
jgi:hypothetical protein